MRQCLLLQRGECRLVNADSGDPDVVDPQKTVTETMSLRDAYIGLKACMWNGDEVYFRCKMSTRLQKLLIAIADSLVQLPRFLPRRDQRLL